MYSRACLIFGSVYVILCYFREFENVFIFFNVRVNGQTIHALVKSLHRQAEIMLPTSTEDFEDFVTALEKTLHPNHFIVVIIKRKLLDVYRLSPDPEDPVLLRRKLERQLQLG